MQVNERIKGQSSSDSINTGLLILRVGAGLSLFLNHGLEKFTGFSTIVQYLPDTYRIGPHASLSYALISDGICSLLVIAGLATRAAAFIILINLLMAFFLVHRPAIFTVPDVELVGLYIAIFLTLFCSGPGSISLDACLRR